MNHKVVALTKKADICLNEFLNLKKLEDQVYLVALDDQLEKRHYNKHFYIEADTLSTESAPHLETKVLSGNLANATLLSILVAEWREDNASQILGVVPESLAVNLISIVKKCKLKNTSASPDTEADLKTILSYDDYEYFNTTLSSPERTYFANAYKDQHRWSYTDRNFCEEVLQTYGSRIKRTSDITFVFNGKTWLKDKAYVKAELKSFIDKMIDAKRLELNDLKSQWIADKIHAFCINKETSSAINSLIDYIEMDKRVLIDSENVFDQDREILVFNNGTLNLRTNKFREHRASDMCTIMCKYDYDANADTSQFESEFRASFDDDEYEVARLVFGYFLTGENNEKLLFLFYGAPESGKSNKIELLNELFGDELTVLLNSSDTEKNKQPSIKQGIARSRRARLVFTGDRKQDFELDDEFIKQSTGDAFQLGELKYVNQTKYKSHWKIITPFNTLPKITSTEPATHKRLFLLTANGKCQKSKFGKWSEAVVKDPVRRAGAIKFLCDCAHDYYKREDPLEMSPSSKFELEMHLRESDVISYWFHENYETFDGQNPIYKEKKILHSDLYKDYEAFCFSYSLKPIKSTELAKRLNDWTTSKKEWSPEHNKEVFWRYFLSKKTQSINSVNRLN